MADFPIDGVSLTDDMLVFEPGVFNKPEHRLTRFLLEYSKTKDALDALSRVVLSDVDPTEEVIMVPPTGGPGAYVALYQIARGVLQGFMEKTDGN